MLTWPLRFAIALYRYTLSPLLGISCRFAPSCSVYCQEALHRHGLWQGGRLSLRRLLRCHPLGGSGWDPVPESAKDPR